MTSSDGPRWWLFTGGILLGSAATLGAAYALQHYFDGARALLGADDTQERRHKATRRQHARYEAHCYSNSDVLWHSPPPSPTRPTRPNDGRPHNGHPTFAPAMPGDSEADWQETEFSDAPARLVVRGCADGSLPDDRRCACHMQHMQQFQGDKFLSAAGATERTQQVRTSTYTANHEV